MESNKYLLECDSDTIKYVIKIKLHMRQVNCNYKRNNIEIKSALCKESEDTICNVKKLSSSHLAKDQ